MAEDLEGEEEKKEEGTKINIKPLEGEPTSPKGTELSKKDELGDGD